MVMRFEKSVTPGLEEARCTLRAFGAVVSESRRWIRPTLGGG